MMLWLPLILIGLGATGLALASGRKAETIPEKTGGVRPGGTKDDPERKLIFDGQAQARGAPLVEWRVYEDLRFEEPDDPPDYIGMMAVPGFAEQFAAFGSDRQGVIGDTQRRALTLSRELAA